MLNTFRGKLLIYFLTPVFIAVVIGNIINIKQLEDFSVNLTSLEFKTNSLDLIETINDLDRDARVVSRRILFNYLLDDHSDSLNFELLSKELSDSKYASSVSLILMPNIEDASSFQVFVARYKDKTIIKEKVVGAELSNKFIENVNTLKTTNAIFWSSKYKVRNNDTLYLYSKFVPVYEGGKMTAIITVNLTVDKIAKLLERYPRGKNENYYILSKSSELIYSTFLNQDNKLQDNNRMIISDSLIRIANLISVKKSESIEVPDWFTVNDKGGERNIVFATSVNEPPLWFFYTAPYSKVIKNSIYKIYPTLIIDVVILLILLIILLSFSNRLSRPIKAMQGAISQFLNTNKKKELSVNRSDELGLLAIDINYMQDELIRKEKELEKLEEAKTAFLKLISHEIRTPLNGIVGSSHFLKETIDNEDLNEFIDMLIESVERLDELSRKALLITELKTRSKLEKDEISDINSFITSQIKENEADFELNRIKIIGELKDRFKDLNKDLLWQAIREILLNTNKFADEDSPVFVEVDNNDDSMIISFGNSGPKIPDDKIEKLGKPFELAQEHYDKYTGLGLSLVSIIMELHGGKFEIRNSKDGVITSLIFRK